MKKDSLKILHECINLIETWRCTFNLPVRNEFTVNKEELKLASKLIIEEYTEYKDADDKIEKLDALGDLLFVCTQYLNVIGVETRNIMFNTNSEDYSKNIDEIYDNFISNYKSNMSSPNVTVSVINLISICFINILKLGVNPYDLTYLIYDSNMSKICNTREEAIKSVEKYKEESVDTYFKNINGKYFIYRLSDSKLLKGINFKLPKIEKLIK